MPRHDAFQGGKWLAVCDICGRTWYNTDLATAWDNSKRCRDCFEPRHPQDFIRPIPDIQSTPWARPWVPSLATGFIFADFPSTVSSFDLNPGLGALFTAPSNGTFTILALTDAATGLVLEVVFAVSIVGDHVVCQRGKNGTLPVAWKAGDSVTQVGVSPVGSLANAVLLENAYYVLLESGDPILLES